MFQNQRMFYEACEVRFPKDHLESSEGVFVYAQTAAVGSRSR